MPDISIIVPVYNVEELLPRCVDSILKQTKKEIEIILVDDGATDRSGEICDEYGRKDSRIRVVHKKNGGLTSAWKAGVKESKSEYVGFVDSDDWIDADMYEKLYLSARKYNSDVVVCGLVFDYEDPSMEKRLEISGFAEEAYNQEALRALFPRLVNGGGFFDRLLQPARVTKLYRRTLVEKNMGLCENAVSVGEDMQITLPVLMDARSLSVVKEFYPYHYWYNMKSMTGSHDPAYLEKISIMETQLQKITGDKGSYDFSGQLRADFLCLAVMGIKNEVLRNPGGRRASLPILRRYCANELVQQAIRNNTMNQLPITIRVFLKLIQHRCSTLCWLVVKLFFKN